MKYIYMLLIGILCISCFQDDTTMDTRRLSEISIDTLKLQKEYNIDLYKTLGIQPIIAQSGKDLKLTYEWQVNYKFYSDSAVLCYKAEELGSYPARLKVSSEDGSAFFEFKIHVNSPYEEGIAVLSEARDGSGMLSFMRKYPAEEIQAGTVEHFELNCLKTSNPGITFAKKPIDISKRVSQLFLSYQDDPTIYMINTKTFEIENIITTPEYPDFVPASILIPDNDARTAIAISENGRIFNLATYEGVVLPQTVLISEYALCGLMYYTEQNLMSYIWDNNLNTVCLYNGWETDNLAPEKTFDGHKPIAMFNDVYGDSFIVMTKHNGHYVSTKLGILLYQYIYDDNWTLIEKRPDIREQRTLEGNTPLDSDTPYAASDIYKKLIYADGNKLYQWYFSDKSVPSTPWKTIDLEGAEITSLALSPDQTQLYVGVVQSGKEGLNGHIYIVDTDKGTPVKDSPYMNVAYKPVKIIYKIK